MRLPASTSSHEYTSPVARPMRPIWFTPGASLSDLRRASNSSKGSVVAASAVPSLHWKEKRANLLEEYTTVRDGVLVMDSDKVFSSPSTAADFCIGSSNNGWLVWKDEDGNTLDAVYRRQLE